MLRGIYLPFFHILLTLLLMVCSSVYAQDADFLKEVESKLAYEENGGVFDFGEHLKGGGRKELAALADEFQEDGLGSG